MPSVNQTILGSAASFFFGIAVALLASYPFGANSIYACFVALFFALAACITAAWMIVSECTRRERVRAERIIDLTVDRMLKRRGLELVDEG